MINEQIHAVRKVIKTKTADIQDAIRNWPLGKEDFDEMEACARQLVAAISEYRRLSDLNSDG
jgi:hypothetical protein